MKILGIDSASPLGGLALYENGQPMVAVVSRKRLTHAENLLPEVEGLLERVQWQLEDLQGIGVVVGPGSFTGVRIGIATAMGLQAGLSIPTVGLSALRAHAMAHPYSAFPVCPLLDLRRGQVYGALYDTASGTPEMLLPEGHYVLGELLEKLPKAVVAVGDSAFATQPLGQEALGNGFRAVSKGSLGLAGVVAEHCERVLQEGGEGEVLRPVYLQASAAEANLKKVKLR